MSLFRNEGETVKGAVQRNLLSAAFIAVFMMLVLTPLYFMGWLHPSEQASAQIRPPAAPSSVLRQDRPEPEIRTWYVMSPGQTVWATARGILEFQGDVPEENLEAATAIMVATVQRMNPGYDVDRVMVGDELEFPWRLI